MNTIAPDSRLTITFTLSWQSGDISHQERLHADPVSVWRDVLDPRLVKQLRGQGEGATASVTLAAAAFPTPRDPRRMVRVRPSQVQTVTGQPFRPRVGRFYPQGLLRGVGGIYRVTTAPCRYLGAEDGLLVFDCNHPLAGRDLRLTAEVRALHPPHKERGGRCEDWLDQICANGPGMQARPETGEVDWMDAEGFTCTEQRPDAEFYRQPRLVQHLDSTCRQALRRQYGHLIAPRSRVLDLMSSWVSHLPEELDLAELTVLGMNAEELDRNPRATTRLVQDVNLNPLLPFGDACFDAVLCTASVEYLRDPIRVLTEAGRVLRPGGLIALAFSNRWFPPKVVRIWTELHEFERLGLATELLRRTGSFEGLHTLSHRGEPRPFDDPHPLPFSDPLYLVWATKR